MGHLLGSHSKLLVQQEAALSAWIAVSSPSGPPLACPGSGPGTQSRPGRAQEQSEQRLEQFGAVGAETARSQPWLFVCCFVMVSAAPKSVL